MDRLRRGLPAQDTQVSNVNVYSLRERCLTVTTIQFICDTLKYRPGPPSHNRG